MSYTKSSRIEIAKKFVGHHPNWLIRIVSLESESIVVVEGIQHHILIFSQHKELLDIIEKNLFETYMKSVAYLHLIGYDEHSRQFEIVKDFNLDLTIDVLMLRRCND